MLRQRLVHLDDTPEAVPSPPGPPATAPTDHHLEQLVMANCCPHTTTDRAAAAPVETNAAVAAARTMPSVDKPYQALSPRATHD